MNRSIAGTGLFVFVFNPAVEAVSEAGIVTVQIIVRIDGGNVCCAGRSGQLLMGDLVALGGVERDQRWIGISGEIIILPCI